MAEGVVWMKCITSNRDVMSGGWVRKQGWWLGTFDFGSKGGNHDGGDLLGSAAEDDRDGLLVGHGGCE
jgi:hypothetical protein